MALEDDSRAPSSLLGTGIVASELALLRRQCCVALQLASVGLDPVQFRGSL